MTTYQVIQHFRWGELALDKGDNIWIEDLGANAVGNLRSRVSKEHYPEQRQEVATQAVASMVQMKKISPVFR